MKVGGSGRISPSGIRSGGAKKAADGFRVDQGAKAGASAGTGAASAMASVDALLALQGADGVEDAGSGRKRAVKRAKKLLDVLEEIRLDLLSGRLPLTKLRTLMATLGERQHEFEDPALTALLEEIDLRARVELAKYENHLRE